jgi:uncharacterized protein
MDGQMGEFQPYDSSAATPRRSQSLWPVPWGVRDILKALGLAICGYVVFLVIALLVILRLGLNPYSPRALGASLLATLGFELILFGLVLWFTKRKYRVSWRDFGFRLFHLEEGYLPVVGIVGAIVVLGVYSEVISLLHLHALTPQSNVPPQVFKGRALIPLFGIEACIIAPIVEESFFRGFIFRGLLSRWSRLGSTPHDKGFWLAALISGVLFAAFHLEPTLLIPFTLVGALFAWIFWRSGSLWSNILAHAIFNLVSFALGVYTTH